MNYLKRSKYVLFLVLFILSVLFTFGHSQTIAGNVNSNQLKPMINDYNSPNNSLNNSWVVIQDRYLYFVNRKCQICKLSLDTNKQEIITSPNTWVDKIYLSNNWIYYSEIRTEKHPASSVFRISLDGKINEKLIDEYNDFLFVYNDWVYYSTNPLDNHFYRLNINNNQRMSIDNKEVSDARVVDNKLYYIDGTSLIKSDLDGGNKQKVAKDVSKFSVADGYIFYILYTTDITDINKLYRMKLDGTSNILIKQGGFIDVLIADQGWVYFSGFDFINYKTHQPLKRVRYDGTGEQRIYNTYVGQLNIVGDWICFFDRGELIRMKKDGSQLQKF